MQLARLALVLVAALVAAARAAPAPQITILHEAPGIAFGMHVMTTAFCDAPARAVVLLMTGEVLQVDAAGTSTQLGNVGQPGPRAAMACDGANRIVVAKKGELAILDGGAVKIVQAPIGPPIGGRTLADGSVAFASNGVVVHWDGAQVDDWQFTPPKYLDRPSLSVDGRAIGGVIRGVVTVFDATGGMREGPRANAVVWADTQSLFATTPQGLVRWRTDAQPDDVTIVDAKVRGHAIAAAGRRLVVTSLFSASVLELDARGAPTGATVASTRWPASFPHLAAGDATFALVVADKRGHLLDLTTSGPLIDEQHATGIIRSLAFSPDGKSLVFSGGRDDLMVADVRTHAVIERLPTPSLAPEQLRWIAGDTIVAGSYRSIVRFDRSRAVTQLRKEPSAGLDDAGDPIDGGVACTKANRAVPPPGWGKPGPLRVDAHADHLAVGCAAGLTVFRAKDLALIAASTAHPYAFALAGPRAFYAESRSLHVVDANGDRLALTLPVERTFNGGAIMSIVASRDRKLLALVTAGGEIAIIDVKRQIPLLVARGNHGSISGLAWAADGRRLAVAAHTAVELWTLPRFK